VERALACSTTGGCVAVATHTTTANVRWANSTLVSNGCTRVVRLTVIAAHRGARGASVGVVSGEGAAGEEIERLVRRAEAAARAAAPARDEQPLVDGRPPARDWAGEIAETSPRALARLGRQLAVEAARLRDERAVLTGYAVHAAETTFLASSTGIRLRHDGCRASLQLQAATADRSRSAWVGTRTGVLDDGAAAGLVATLRRRLRWARRSIELPPGRYETLLPPPAVSDLMAYLYSTLGAQGALDGRTVFAAAGGGTRVGERLTDAGVALHSDPAETAVACRDFVAVTEPGETSSAWDNGLPLGRTSWIADGTLAALVQTRSSASASDLPLTPWIENLVLSGPDGGPALDEMIASTADGLLPTCLWYMREVDPRRLLLTGVTRDGTFVVRNGEIAGAANNFRYNESPVELLARIAEVGRTEPTLGREWGDYALTAMPTLRVAGFNMSSVSRAV
jgi:predicted Zn-dependent protease